MEHSKLLYDQYDLSRIICFVEPSSEYATWAFKLHHNVTQLAPRLHNDLASSDLATLRTKAMYERESTPIISAAAEIPNLPSLLAVTTDVDRLLNARGHTFGSNSDTCDVLLDETRKHGVSGTHLRLFVDDEEGQGDNFTLQNLSENSIKVMSSQQRIEQSLTQGQQILLAGGTWSVSLHAKVPIVFKLIFPDHGTCSLEYNMNWISFHEANVQASNTLSALVSVQIMESANATPLVRDFPYIINWSKEGIIGEGTLSTVRKAFSQVTKEVVAAKVFNNQGSMLVGFESLQKLRHKHIVTYKAFFQDRSSEVLIMDFLDGDTLHDRLRQDANRRLPIPRAKLHWNQLGRAVLFLHDHNVVHGDIKPSNIMFNKSEDLLKLCDFGLLKQPSSSEVLTSKQLEISHYVAPEVLNGEPYTFASDMWSLGIIVLEMYRLLLPITESMRIAGADDSDINGYVPVSQDTALILPSDLDLVREQLSRAPKERLTAAILVGRQRQQHLIQMQPDSRHEALTSMISNPQIKRRKGLGSVRNCQDNLRPVHKVHRSEISTPHAIAINGRKGLICASDLWKASSKKDYPISVILRGCTYTYTKSLCRYWLNYTDGLHLAIRLEFPPTTLEALKAATLTEGVKTVNIPPEYRGKEMTQIVHIWPPDSEMNATNILAAAGLKRQQLSGILNALGIEVACYKHAAGLQGSYVKYSEGLRMFEYLKLPTEDILEAIKNGWIGPTLRTGVLKCGTTSKQVEHNVIGDDSESNNGDAYFDNTERANNVVHREIIQSNAEIESTNNLTHVNGVPDTEHGNRGNCRESVTCGDRIVGANACGSGVEGHISSGDDAAANTTPLASNTSSKFPSFEIPNTPLNEVFPDLSSHLDDPGEDHPYDISSDGGDLGLALTSL